MNNLNKKDSFLRVSSIYMKTEKAKILARSKRIDAKSVEALEYGLGRLDPKIQYDFIKVIGVYKPTNTFFIIESLEGLDPTVVLKTTDFTKAILYLNKVAKP